MKKKRTKVFAVLAVVCLAVSVLAGTIAYLGASDIVNFKEVFGGLLENWNSSTGDSSSSSSAPNETPDASEEIPEELTFDRPAALRAIKLSIGTDILPEGKTTEAELRSQLEDVINRSGEYGINAFTVDAVVDGKTLYRNETAQAYTDYDVLKVIAEVLKEKNIYLYLSMPLNVTKDDSGLLKDSAVLGEEQITTACAAVSYLVEQYAPASVILTNYYNRATSENYAAYRREGGGVGYENWMRLQTYRLVDMARQTIRENNLAVQVSLEVDPVWAYSAVKEGGIDLSVGTQALTDGFADTKLMVQNKLCDNLFVRNYGSLSDPGQPFEKVAAWWMGVTKDLDIPTYFILANEKVGTAEPGWSGVDQLARQAATLGKLSSQGVVLRSLTSLAANAESTQALMKYFDGQLDVNSLFTDLAILSPKSVNTTTYEDRITFTGIADPNFDILINGEKITLDEKGRFVYPVDLAVGSNRITFESKGTKLTYTVFRKVQLIKAVAPVGTVAIDGGTVLTIEATAYKDAVLTATINGTTVKMAAESYGDGGETTMYGKYVGKYTVPASKANAYSIGAFTVRATWNGTSESKTGASVTINRRVDETVAGNMFRVVNNQSLVYPTYITDYTPLPHGYTLPAGSIDYIVGDKIILDADYVYYKTLSGVKVRTKDIQFIGDSEMSMNTIGGISVDGGGSYTDITFQNTQNVTYSVESKPVTYPRWDGAYWDVSSYSPTTVEIVMNYTSSAPDTIDVSGSKLFSACRSEYIEVGGKQAVKYTLTLRNPGKYYGIVRTLYNGTNLTIRFINPVSISSGDLSGMRIYIDPGHSAADLVTGGAWNGVRECVITNQIGKKVVAALQARGATVMTHDNLVQDLSMAQRVQQATDFGANVFISIHINGASGSTPHGPCTFYFYPTDWKLAVNLEKQLENVIGGGYLYSPVQWSNGYAVVRTSMMPGILAEYGFGTNPGDFAKLTDPAYQDQLAIATVNAIVAAYS